MPMIAATFALALQNDFKAITEAQKEGAATQAEIDARQLLFFEKIGEQIIALVKNADIAGTDHGEAHISQRIVS